MARRHGLDQFVPRVKEKVQSLIASVMTDNHQLNAENEFSQANLNDNIAAALRAMGITRLTKFQCDFFAKLSTNPKRLVLSGAPGIGKTISSGIAIINHVDTTKNQVQVLCLCSTYESAIQTQNTLSQMAAFSGVSIGTAIQDGTVELGSKLTCHVLVGTPKEMVSFKMMRLFHIEKVTLCVFDDADTIVTTQLIKEQIIRAVGGSCRILLIHSGQAASKFDFIAPYELHTNVCDQNIEHFFADCPTNTEKLKMALLMAHELNRYNLQGVIYVETRNMVEGVGTFLALKGISTTMIHAGMNYVQRKDAFESFRSGTTTVAIATNVLERGIDIPNIRAVMNFELPVFCETNNADVKRYWYRIGRSSRFGRRGMVINLATPAEQKPMHDLLQAYKMRPIFIE